MSRANGLDGRDEPARDGDDHAELFSELDSHDLAIGSELVETDETKIFEADPGADPDETFPQSIASGGPTPSGVILWTRINPAVFERGEPLAVQVATDDNFESIAYAVDKTENAADANREVKTAYRVPEGAVNLEDVTDEYRTDTARRSSG